MTGESGGKPGSNDRKRLLDLSERLRLSGQLRSIVPAPGSDPDRATAAFISGVVYDSRRVGEGSLFVAIPGSHSDGRDFVGASARSGAVAAIVEKPIGGASLIQLVVSDARLALAMASAWWYRDPSLDMGVVGVTGTDGKTTTSFLATAVLEAAGISTGLITTVATKVGTELVANAEHVTTPQAPELQEKLREMVAAGNEAAIVETTSHGLALHRVAEIDYDIAIFTNLTHEHLELHGTFEAYREAKLSLFSGLGRGLGSERPRELAAKELARAWPRVAIVNLDDPSAPFFIDAAERAGARLLTYGAAGTTGAVADSGRRPDVASTRISETARGLAFEAITPTWRGEVALQLAGRFNVSNALAAIALGEALGLSPDAIVSGLAGLPGVPGRMERVDCGQPFGVIVDYAHSPAALEKVLDILAPLTESGRGSGLIAVFGSAGERDVGKRPLMGRIAAERCRLVVVTDEDPRGEDRLAILDQIAEGSASAGKVSGEDVLCIPDRSEAIAEAFSRARPGDVVLLAGKGHEQSIITASGPVPWDEKAEAIRALERLGFRKDREARHSQSGDGN